MLMFVLMGASKMSKYWRVRRSFGEIVVVVKSPDDWTEDDVEDHQETQWYLAEFDTGDGDGGYIQTEECDEDECDLELPAKDDCRPAVETAPKLRQMQGGDQ